MTPIAMLKRRIGRRNLIVGIGTWLAIPRATYCAARRPLIGMLYPASEKVAPPNVGAFRARLGELGLVEDRDYKLEIRYVVVPSDRNAIQRAATELLALSPSVIVFGGFSTAPVLHQLTASVPLVGIGLGDDPVAFGLVASFARPGGNITGMTVGSISAITGKQLALLKELVPSITRVDALLEPDDVATPASIQNVARSLDLTLRTVTIVRREDLSPAIAAAKAGAQAIFIGTGPFFNTHRSEIADLIAKARLPALWAGNNDAVSEGGLISYGPNITKNYSLAGDYVARILGGASPADLPIQQPISFELIINLKSAKALGLTIPTTLLAGADEVIE